MDAAAQNGSPTTRNGTRGRMSEARRKSPSFRRDRRTAPTTQPSTPSQTSSNQIKKKLSYLEAREYSTIEQEIADAEQQLQSHREAMEDPAIATDAARLEKAMADVAEAEGRVDELYLRWTELEAKLK